MKEEACQSCPKNVPEKLKKCFNFTQKWFILKVKAPDQRLHECVSLLRLSLTACGGGVVFWQNHSAWKKVETGWSYEPQVWLHWSRKKKNRQKLQEWEHESLDESLDPLVSGSILSLRFDRRIDYCLLTLTAFVVNICFVSLTRQGVECFHCGHLSKIHFNQKTKKTKEHGEKCSYNKTWMKEYSSGHGTTVQTTSTVCLQSRKASQGKVKGLNSLL